MIFPFLPYPQEIRVNHGTDRPADTMTTADPALSTVANPRRTRVDEEGRPVPAPPAKQQRGE